MPRKHFLRFGFGPFLLISVCASCSEGGVASASAPPPTWPVSPAGGGHPNQGAPERGSPLGTQDRLRAIRDRKLAYQEYSEAREFLWKLKAEVTTYDAGVATLLKEVAEKYGIEKDWYDLTLDAIDVLWKMGEPREYFLANVEKHAENPVLASVSITALACSPDAALLKILAPLKKSKDERLRYAVSGAEAAYAVSRAYQQIRDDRERAKFLVRRTRLRAPMGTWAEGAFHALAEKAPEAVADAIWSMDPQEGWAPGSDPSFMAREKAIHQEWLLRISTDETRRRFREIAAQKGLQPKREGAPLGPVQSPGSAPKPTEEDSRTRGNSNSERLKTNQGPQ